MLLKNFSYEQILRVLTVAIIRDQLLIFMRSYEEYLTIIFKQYLKFFPSYKIHLKIEKILFSTCNHQDFFFKNSHSIL
ncbi:hypothetical protein EMIT0210MI2_250024 [Priestia megaterium]